MMNQEGISEIIGLLLRMQIDVLLTAMSGFLSLATALHCYRSTHATTYKYFIVTDEQYDVIGWCTLFMTFLGMTAIAVAILRLRGFCKLNFNKYVATLVITMLSYFAIGLLLTEFRNSIPDKIGGNMKSRLQEAMLARTQLGVGFGQSEAWDLIQLQLQCCGVENYQEYFASKAGPKDQMLPMSCCVMKTITADDGPMVQNPGQCTLDAARGVKESIFLHTQGCQGPLTRWVVHHVSKLTAMLFAAILVQAIAILYLSWQGYQKSAAGNRTR